MLQALEHGTQVNSATRFIALWLVRHALRHHDRDMGSLITRAALETTVMTHGTDRIAADADRVMATDIHISSSKPLHLALIILRVGTAALFMAHALVRVMKSGSIPQFGLFLEKSGVPQGIAVVWLITVFELGGGLLMALGFRTRYMAAGFGVILLGGIVLIHRHLGWFVGEHGTGGSEYSVALLLALLVIASADSSAVDRRRSP